MQTDRNVYRPSRLSRLAAAIASIVVTTTVLGAVLAAFDSLADGATTTAMARYAAERQA